MKIRKAIIWPILLGILLIVSAVVFKDMRSGKGKITADTISRSENKNDNISVENQNNNSATDNRQLTTDNLELPVFIYHHIRNYNNPDDNIGTNLSVSPADFAKQLDLIKEKGYTTITFADILNGDIPPKSIILTFDDGYKNFYQNAYPELKKRGMKAVSYIIVNDVGGEDHMTGDQIIEIKKNGIEIGSHTLSHSDLTTAFEAKAKKEIIESKKYLEDLLGKKVISFCYPSGKFNNTIEKLVKDAGYDFAVTTKGDITKFADPFALNRYRVNNGTNISSYIK